MLVVDPLSEGALLAGRYRVGPLIGAGGMAHVHRAHDELLERDVAVKAFTSAVVDPANAKRAEAEIALLASLLHGSLVTMFDAGREPVGDLAITWMVMELVDGPSLAERLAEGPLTAPEAARVLLDLSEALIVVHRGAVVHRDVKPANVLLAPSPVPGRAFDAKLADFGIATMADSARITATGTVLGSAAYLSPEQTSGQTVGPPTDVYSLGLMLLESLTGRQEYPGTLLESLSARLARDPEIPGWLGYAWKSLLAAMTARDPEARPTAAEVVLRAEALRLDPAALAVVRPEGDTTTTAADDAGSGPTAAAPGIPPAPPRLRRRRWPIAAGIGAGAALVGGAIAFGALAAPPADAPAPAVASDPPAGTVAVDGGTADPPGQTTEP